VRGGPRVQRDEGSPDFERGERVVAAGRQYTISLFSVTGINPVINEAVRFRCAQTHDCRFCSNARLKDALDMGFDEEMHSKVSQYETSDFDPATIAALRLCDAIIVNPDAADEALAEELRRHFTEEQIAEICFDVLHWGEQKYLVSLALEEPPWDGPTVIEFNDEGGHDVHGPIGSVAPGA